MAEETDQEHGPADTGAVDPAAMALALDWLGRRDDAQKQFAIAAALDLSSADRSELGRVMKTHV